VVVHGHRVFERVDQLVDLADAFFSLVEKTFLPYELALVLQLVLEPRFLVSFERFGRRRVRCSGSRASSEISC
jgi:hypothetical protein